MGEADILRGPYREAKVYIRRTLILKFTELGVGSAPYASSTPVSPPPLDDIDGSSASSTTASSWRAKAASASVAPAPTLVGKPAEQSMFSVLTSVFSGEPSSTPPESQPAAAEELSTRVSPENVVRPRPKTKVQKPQRESNADARVRRLVDPDDDRPSTMV